MVSIGRRLGVSSAVLYSWLRVPLEQLGSPHVRPVEVAPVPTAEPMTVNLSAGTVVMPSGVRVEGLGVEDIIAILVALG
jgi:hypothetical protein